MSIFNGIIAILAALTMGQNPPCPEPRLFCEQVCCAAAMPVRLDIEAGGKLFSYIDAPITPSDFTVAAEIERRQINAPIERKIELVDEYIKNGADFKTALGVCFPLLHRTVDAAAEHIYLAPENSRVVYKNGKFSVTREKAGRELDQKRLYAAVYYTLKYGANETVKATSIVLPPEVTAAELSKDLAVRAEYTTEFFNSSKDRAHNVALAVSKFDGARLPAGETLSFNALVGERTEQNGFKSAKIIMDGKYIDGVGGGVCQASTAVYNAALAAGLSCRANAHSICPSYCPPGLDAMISSVSDLTITNNTGKDVYFSTSAGGGKATVRVVGAPNEFVIVPESEIEKTVAFEQKESLDVEGKYFSGGQSGDRILVAPGKEGYESCTYLNYYKDGKFVKREKIRANIYKPVPQMIAIAP